VRASSPEDIVHRDEVAGYVKHRGGTFHELIGSRHEVRTDARSLRQLVPDLAESDVYVCGPASFTNGIVAAVATLGVPAERIHLEAFSF